MRSLAATLFLVSAACALPQNYGSQNYYYRPGYGSYGLGDPYQPMTLRSFRYGQNPIRNQAYQTPNQGYQTPNQGYQTPNQGYQTPNQGYQTPNQGYQPQSLVDSRNVASVVSVGTQNSNSNNAFGNIGQGFSAEQRALYLPSMRALLRVMESDRQNPQDINNLLVETRELNKKVPKGKNVLANFGSFGIDGLESMGLPESGDIITNVDGIPHIRTTFGAFPLSDTSLMTAEEKQRFLPSVRAFTNVLEKGNADANDTAQLLQYAQDLMKSLPSNNSGFDLANLGNLGSLFGSGNSY